MTLPNRALAGSIAQRRKPPRPLVPGNLDLDHRPVAVNRDGSVSTVRSISVTDDQGRATLLPTVVNGMVVSNASAIRHYKQSGEHLGVFANEDDANTYAESLHESQAAKYPKPTRRYQSVGKS